MKSYHTFCRKFSNSIYIYILWKNETPTIINIYYCLLLICGKKNCIIQSRFRENPYHFSGLHGRYYDCSFFWWRARIQEVCENILYEGQVLFHLNICWQFFAVIIICIKSIKNMTYEKSSMSTSSINKN